MGNKNTDKTEKTEKTEAFTVKKLAEWISIKKIAAAVGIAFLASMVPNWLLAFIARPSGTTTDILQQAIRRGFIRIL
jgi:hypothetical protein